MNRLWSKRIHGSGVGPRVGVVLVAISLLSTVALAQPAQFDGSWQSTLFGGSGSGGARVVIDMTSATTATYTASFSGEIFGVMTPPLVSVTMGGTLVGDVWTFTLTGHPVFGDSTITVDNVTGAIAGSATGIMAYGADLTMTGTGTISGYDGDDTIQGTYDIFQVSNPVAVGSGSMQARQVTPGVPTAGNTAKILFIFALLLAGFLVLRKKSLTPA